MLSRLKTYVSRFTGVERRLLLLLFLVFVASVAFSVWQGRRGQIEVPARGGEYTEGLVGEVRYINPLLAPAAATDADVSRIVFGSLYKFDDNLNLVADLADGLPQVDPSGKEYTVKLRDNVFWHDGARFTADDAVFTFGAIQDPKYVSPLRSSWNRVTVTKIDDLTLKLTTREASSTFVANLTVGLLPKHIWGSEAPESFTISKYNLEPVGTGPFRVTGLKRDRNGKIRSVMLEAFERYHGGRPNLDKLQFRLYDTPDQLVEAYQGRDIKGLGYVPFDQSLFIKAKASLQQFQLPLPQYRAVFINRAKNPAPLEDVRVRLALAKSVDKKRIVNEVYGGQTSEAYGPILPGHLGYHEQIPGADMNIYDPERAKALLEEAGWITDPTTGFRRDKLGRIITLELATNNFPLNARMAAILKENWEGIGVQVMLNIETSADLETKFIRPRAYELLLHSQNVGPDPDPFAFWHSTELRDPGANFSTFSNKTADKLLVEARGPLSADERAKRYRQITEILVGDVPAIFLTRDVFVYNVSSAIKGLKLGTIVTPADRFGNISEWYIETKRVKK